MTQFWIFAVLLLIVALLLLLIPVLRVRKDQAEEDRTALNIALYEEHIVELEAQHESGVMTLEQLEEGRIEASRELLDDTDVGRPKQSANLGSALPLIAALLVPVCGLGLYFYWGSSDKVALTLSLQEQPKTVEEMLVRLEETVRLQPDSVDAWYFLARTYMGEQRHQEAVNAFEKTMELVGRRPEVLGQLAQAMYFTNNKQWSGQLQDLVDEALRQDPNEATSLGLVGIAAFESQRYQEAIDAWTRLASGLDQQDPSYAAIQTGIERARASLASTPQASDSAVPSVDAASSGEYQLVIDVALGDELSAQLAGTDTVFVFARAADGPPMPLAAKRLTVADLPARIVLTDADSLVPQLKLSSVAQLKLQASISNSADAMQIQWSSEAVLLDAEQDRSAQKIVINKAN